MYDVIIVGSGPAGATAALALRGRGLRLAVVDKAAFPRDKVCGDAIGGRVERVLDALDPAFGAAWRAFPDKQAVPACRLVGPGGASVTLRYRRPGYVATRWAFDNFLYQLARRHTEADFLTGRAVRTVQTGPEGTTVTLADGERLAARFLIGADGAQSVVARYAGHRMERKHYSGGVRAYFRGVAPTTAEPCLEGFFLKDYLPGYCWIFPLPDGTVNVGFGMLSEAIARRRVNLRDSLSRLLAETPELRTRFAGAEQLGPTVGFGLPFGSRRRPLSGERFVLTGDAASLIDPASGDGIGNAMLSGRLAGEHVLRALYRGRPDAAFNRHYDRAVYGALWAELRQKYWVQRALHDRAWLIDALVGQASRRPWLREVARKAL